MPGWMKRCFCPISVFLIITLLSTPAPVRAQDAGVKPAAAARVLEVRKIWDRAPHNAFTDLIRFEERWFCVFREGKAHVSPDGALRVITSPDALAPAR